MIQLSSKGTSKEDLFAQFIFFILEAKKNSAVLGIVPTRPFLGVGLSHFLNDIPSTSDYQVELEKPLSEQKTFNTPCLFKIKLLVERRVLFIILEWRADMFTILEFLFILYYLLASSSQNSTIKRAIFPIFPTLGERGEYFVYGVGQ